MKIEELSIGDWVVAKLAKWDYDSPEETEPMRIVCIDNSEPKQAFADLIGSGMVKQSAWIDDLRPIPLTPEILEKNGFSLCNGCTSRWELECGVCWIKVTSPENYADVTIYKKVAHGHRRVIDEMQITGVHQLQHTLRLAGIDKEIEV